MIIGGDGGGRAEGPPPFLKLADLAARWEIAESEVMEMVRRRGVPFNRMTASIARIKWQKVRFSLPAIEEWERANQERIRGDGSSPAPSPRRPRAAETAGATLLGNWRESAPPVR